MPLGIFVEPINQSSNEKKGCSAHLRTMSFPVYALANLT